MQFPPKREDIFLLLRKKDNPGRGDGEGGAVSEGLYFLEDSVVDFQENIFQTDVEKKLILKLDIPSPGYCFV